MLPTDFAIFSSPKLDHAVVHPDPGERLAARRPRVCAISFSWCGKTRSMPPPWMSKSSPRSSSAIAEHSMCQPGRPRPQGESQAVSSSGLCAFQSAKSSGSRFSVGALDRPRPGRIWSTSRFESLPYAGKRAHAEVDVAARPRRRGRARSAPRSGRRSAPIVSVASGSWSGRPSPSRSVSATVGGGHLARELRRDGTPRVARGVVDLVVDVGDVLDERRRRSPRARGSA